MMTVSIDGKRVEARPEETILETALEAGIYIPHLCSHPDLSPASLIAPEPFVFSGGKRIERDPNPPDPGCNLCYVEVTGEGEPLRACDTLITEGMEILTGSEKVRSLRASHLSKLLSFHPHSCLTCAQKEGCSLTQCSSNVPEEERCCEKFGNCEFEKLALYIGIDPYTSRYIPSGSGTEVRGGLFEERPDLCAGCLRCVRVCREYGAGVLGYVWSGGRWKTGNRFSPSFEESGCRFCGLCVSACPTAALMDTEPFRWAKKDEMVPCVKACPLNIDIPRYLELAGRGDFESALSLIMEKAPLPGILGYACQRPCEDACKRGVLNDPVAICDVKRFIVDHAAETGVPTFALHGDEDGKRVAVIGSGPGGLTALHYLRTKGYSVTLFEREEEPGGMMRYGIPPYRLPRDVLERDISRIIDEGDVLMVKGKSLGNDISISQLMEEFDAVLISTGAGVPRRLSIPGEGIEGVIQGLELLRMVSSNEPGTPFQGMEIGVIGGGNVAIDSARTSLRLGASRVTLICLEKREEMPATPEEVEEGEEEGVMVLNSLGPIRIEKRGRLQVTLSPCLKVFDEEGRFDPVLDTGEERTLTFDRLVLSIGQSPERETCEKGGLFFAGDVLTGSSTIPLAMRSGSDAASRIDRFLGGNGALFRSPARGLTKIELKREEGFGKKERIRGRKEEPSSRARDFRAVRKGLDMKGCIEEAGRCLSCHLRLLLSSPPLPPERFLPLDAAHIEEVLEEPGAFRIYDVDERVIKIKGAQNLKRALMEELEGSPGGSYFEVFPDPMYSKRESELLQEYIKLHGKMPGDEGDELDDLY